MKTLLTLLPCLLSGLLLFAQVEGEYRSKQTGSWNQLSTWEIYNGSSWVPATEVPSTSFVTIRASHSVTITEDLEILYLTIEGTGGLVISGCSVEINESMECSGNVTLNGGAFSGEELNFYGIGGFIWNSGTVNSSNFSFYDETTIDVNGTGSKEFNGKLDAGIECTVNLNEGAGDIDCRSASMVFRGPFNQYSDCSFVKQEGQNDFSFWHDVNIAGVNDKLGFSSCGITFGEGARLIGQGTLDGSGGNDFFINTEELVITEGLEFLFGAPASDIEGTGSLKVEGVFNFFTGNIKVAVEIADVGIWNMGTAANKFVSSEIDIQPGGHASCDQGSIVGNNGTINVYGSFELTGTCNMPAVNNTTNQLNIFEGGTLIKNNTTTIYSDWAWNNRGNVNANAGTLWWRNAGSNWKALNTTGAQTVITISNNSIFYPTSTFSGRLYWQAGTANLQGDFEVPANSILYVNTNVTGPGQLVIGENGLLNFTKGIVDVPVIMNTNGRLNSYLTDEKKLNKTLTLQQGAHVQVYSGTALGIK